MSAQRLQKNGFFVVGLYDDGAALLTPNFIDLRGEEPGTGLTLAEAKHSVWWQHEPRGESPTPWFICKPDPDAPGIMLGWAATLVLGRGVVVNLDEEPHRLDIGAKAFPLTERAHESTLAAIWPAQDDEEPGPETGAPFSFPEINLWLDESEYIKAADLIGAAASLAGDGQGGELGGNPEYERGLAELIARFMGWEAERVPEIIAAIHGTARDNAGAKQ